MAHKLETILWNYLCGKFTNYTKSKLMTNNYPYYLPKFQHDPYSKTLRQPAFLVNYSKFPVMIWILIKILILQTTRLKSWQLWYQLTRLSFSSTKVNSMSLRNMKKVTSDENRKAPTKITLEFYVNKVNKNPLLFTTDK